MSIETIAIIGTGKVGASLGMQWSRAGYRIVYGTRNPSGDAIRETLARTGGAAKAASPAEAILETDLALFAVPWLAAEATLGTLGPLEGKILIDSTNPLAFRDGKDMEIALPTSAAQMIQGWAPAARVVKGFNATNWRIMANPAAAGGPVSIPLAGDDADAKARVAPLARALGFEPVDAGPLANARHIEHMAMLYVSFLLRPGAEPIEFHLRPRQKL
jgi:predicted dinucleotide-binding enzyme